MDGEVIRLYTETAWSPCNEVFDLVREKYPSLYYYFQAEEPGMGIYETNDSSGVYFPDRYFFDACTPEEEYIREYFENQEDAFKWIEKETGKPIRSSMDVEALDADWSEKCEDAFCYLHEFEVIS